MICRKNSGFTLLELLVVISIIAILAVSLTPAFSRAREAARRATCSQNMSQIHKAITMYESDFQCYPSMAAAGQQGYQGDAQTALNLLYRQYCDDVRVFSCPSKMLSPSYLQTIGTSASSGPFFTEEPAENTYTKSSSYGYSPGHTSVNSRVVIMADHQGTGASGSNAVQTSSNHGIGAGQNVLSAGGGVAFLTGSQANTNQLGKDDAGNVITDPSIFNYGDITSGYSDWDSQCR